MTDERSRERTDGEAARLLSLPLGFLLERADALREAAHGRVITACSIVNAKSGDCPQDCAFCAQSIHWGTDAPRYPLLSEDDILSAALRAEEGGASRFSIVTSGLSPTDAELERICRAVERIRAESSLAVCASLGVLDEKRLAMLASAGLSRYHHNLETARSFYPSICSTRSWEENRDAIVAAREAGLETCCGGIFGMGESLEQRGEALEQIRELAPDGVPVNYLVPIEGTPLERLGALPVEEALKTAAVARIIMPDAEVIICGGREFTLGDRQGELFRAGASGLMVGDYLTVRGNTAEADRRLVHEAGLVLASEVGG